MKFNRGVLLVGGLVVLAGVVAVYQWLGTAWLMIETQPAEAEVRIDGALVGLTPVEVEVGVGKHLLEVTHSYYAPISERIALERGDRTRRSFELKRREGILDLMSNPRGAWVEVDGERLSGKTPVRTTVMSGPHEVVMGMDERRSTTQTITALPGRTVSTTLDLDIDPHGSVTITTNPRGADISFPGTDLSYRPGVRMPMGEYLVRAEKAGYGAQEFRYTVRYGSNLHHVDLKREYGALNVAVTPSGSEVLVSYPGARQRAFEAGMRVPVGAVEIRARAMGYRTAYRKINLTSSGYRARLQLEPIDVSAGDELSDPLKSGGNGPALVVVPSGSFTMGDNAGPLSERPERVIRLTQPFAIGKFEVSVGQFLRYADSVGQPVSKKLDRDQPELPMRDLSWQEASDYAAWLTEQTSAKYRLPSEAEWEYVARAGNRATYSFGSDPTDICGHGNVADRSTRKIFREWRTVACDDGFGRLAPIGSFQANPFGVHDMHGNVAEWVVDCSLSEYADAPRDGGPATAGLDCRSRSFRGGSWDSMPEETASAYRNAATMGNDDRGFRVVREL